MAKFAIPGRAVENYCTVLEQSQVVVIKSGYFT